MGVQGEFFGNRATYAKERELLEKLQCYNALARDISRCVADFLVYVGTTDMSCIFIGVR